LPQPVANQIGIMTTQKIVNQPLTRRIQWVSLKEALELVVLCAHDDSPKFEQASVRWPARYALRGETCG
jgi:hypothetical protein